MSEFKVNTITNRDGSHGPQVCGITSFGSSGMQLPSGPTEFRGGRGKSLTYGGVFSGSYVRNINIMDIATTGSAVAFVMQLRLTLLLVAWHQQLVEFLNKVDLQV